MDDVFRPPDGTAPAALSSRSRALARWAATQLAAGLGCVYGHPCTDSFGILMYHRVTETVPSVVDPSWNVTPGQFRAQLAGLLARGFQAWPLRKLLAHRAQYGSVPPMAFVVTFDDGYANNYVNALPILAELNVPATIFVATAYLDSEQRFPFDDWLAAGTQRVPADSWRPLRTAECEELLASGLIELGAHTHHHELYLGRGDEFRADLGQCLAVLERKFGITRPSFALPYGAGDQVMVDIVRDVGMSCCLWTGNQPVDVNEGAFEWGRFDVSQRDTPSVLAAKLSGWYAAVTATGKRLYSPISDLSRAGRK